MVNSDLPPSRAATLTLVGGELAFDFANTASGRGWPTHLDHLRAPADVADWAGHARVLPPDDAAWLKGEANGNWHLGQSLLGAALKLREDIFVIGRELAAGLAPPAGAIENVHSLHAHCLAKARLAPFEGRFAWNWRTRADPVEAVLGPISLSAMTTLMQADLTRVKQCQGEKCGWLFLDMTKNKSPPMVRNGNLRQPGQTKATRPKISRTVRRAGLGVALLLTLLAALAGCGASVETDQARLCRMAIPALSAADARVAIVAESEDDDRKGVVVDYSLNANPASHRIQCRFLKAGRPDHSDDLVASPWTGSGSMRRIAIS